MTESFGIRIYKEYFNIAAAHFLIFDDGSREELHGHNYRVQMSLDGRLDEAHDIFIDFSHIKPIVKAVCDEIDHVTLLPRQNRYLTVTESESAVEAVYHTGDRWVFPRRDVMVLPITNTSAERLAQYACHEILKRLAADYPDATVSRVELSMEESRGQAAVYRLQYHSPQRLAQLDIFEPSAIKQPVA